MIAAVLFDLGNTLVRYYHGAEFGPILQQAIGEAAAVVAAHGYPIAADLHERVAAENHESPNHRVRPLEERLAAIFETGTNNRALLGSMTRAFMRPIFARAELYNDTLETLRTLRAQGMLLGLVSNSPWGSPSQLWHEEITRLGIAGMFDAVVFCGDVGWRKPAREIFHHALHQLGARSHSTLFVGDDPRWDIAGPTSVGIDAVLIDRGHDAHRSIGAGTRVITSLADVIPIATAPPAQTHRR